MATISFSTAFIADVMSRLTLTNAIGERTDSESFGYELPYAVWGGAYGNQNLPWAAGSSSRPHAFGGIFADVSGTLTGASYSFGSNPFTGQNSQPRTSYSAPTVTSAAILFRNSSGTTLTSYLASELTRTIDAEGYAVLANFPPKLPTVAGTISDIYIRTDSGAFRTLTLTVGAPDSAADVQFDDRALVTSQPWRLDGSIKFRVPMSYEFTT